LGNGNGSPFEVCPGHGDMYPGREVDQHLLTRTSSTGSYPIKKDNSSKNGLAQSRREKQHNVRRAGRAQRSVQAGVGVQPAARDNGKVRNPKMPKNAS
jgi:hypothetical protein